MSLIETIHKERRGKKVSHLTVVAATINCLLCPVCYKWVTNDTKEPFQVNEKNIQLNLLKYSVNDLPHSVYEKIHSWLSNYSDTNIVLSTTQ